MKQSDEHIESPVDSARFARELVDSLRGMAGYDTGGCWHILAVAMLFTLADMTEVERKKAIVALNVLIGATNTQL